MVKKKKEQRNCPSFFQFIGNDYLVTLRELISRF